MKIAVIAENRQSDFNVFITNLVQNLSIMATLGTNESGQYREVGVYYDTCFFLGGREQPIYV